MVMKMMFLLRALLRSGAVAAVALLSGCQTLYPVPKVEVADTAMPQAAAVTPPPPAPNGSIFQSAQYRPLFEDRRARAVGDTLTVQIVEKIAASQRSTSSIDKSGKIEAGVTALPFLSPNSFNRASASGNSANTFAGKGSTESSNDFSGTITAIVTGVLPNGLLQVAGEKQIGVNQHVDVLKFSGVVDPRSIQPGNAIASTQIANVRVEHRGRGAIDDAQGIGWLGRFFLNLSPL
jgi:flagellar L-ring protein FlgH